MAMQLQTLSGPSPWTFTVPGQVVQCVAVLAGFEVSTPIPTGMSMSPNYRIQTAACGVLVRGLIPSADGSTTQVVADYWMQPLSAGRPAIGYSNATAAIIAITEDTFACPQLAQQVVPNANNPPIPTIGSASYPSPCTMLAGFMVQYPDNTDDVQELDVQTGVTVNTDGTTNLTGSAALTKDDSNTANGYANVAVIAMPAGASTFAVQQMSLDADQLNGKTTIDVPAFASNVSQCVVVLQSFTFSQSTDYPVYQISFSTSTPQGIGTPNITFTAQATLVGQDHEGSYYASPTVNVLVVAVLDG